MTCPSKDDKEYQKIVDFLNGDTQSAYRIWRRNEEMNPGEGTMRTLASFNRTPSQKYEDIKKYSERVLPPDEGHIYRLASDISVEVNSMSKSLDEVPEIASRVIESLGKFSDSGTNIHSVFQQIVNSSDDNDPNIKASASVYGIDDKAVDALIKLKNELAKMGTLYSEQILYMDGVSENRQVAGTADIIIYTPEGKKFIVDLKTAYITADVKKKGKTPWDPFAFRAWKAKRYTTQVMGYGRMSEWADGQPASDHFIAPIVIELNDDNDLSKGYKSIDVLPIENVKKWGGEESNSFTDFAQRTLDIIFNQNSEDVATASLIGEDESSKVYQNLSGDFSSHEINPEEIARRRPTGVKFGKNGYYDDAGTHWPFNSDDPNAQIQQIVNDYVNKTAKVNSDLSYGITNYINSGDVKYLKSIDKNSRGVEKILRPFVGRTDIKVLELRKVKGFDNKKNWIIIEEGDTRHLFYIGSENLAMTFNTEGFQNDSLFGKFVNKTHSRRVINSPLKNTYGDARKMEGTIIAVQLKNSYPSIKFGQTMVYGLGSGSAFADIIDLKVNIESLKNIMNDNVLRDKILTPNLISALTKTPDYKDYVTDYGQLLYAYIAQRLDIDPGSVSYDMKSIAAGTKFAANNQSKRKEMFEKIANYLKEEVRMDSQADYDTFLLSQYYLQLQDLDVSLIPTGILNTVASLPQNIANPMLGKINAVLQSSVSDMSVMFRDMYKTKFTDTLKKYLDSKGGMSTTVDYVTGGTALHYEELYEMMNRKINTDRGVENISLPGFSFKQEGTAEFNALSPEAQELIKVSNDIIQNIANLNEIDWSKSRIPLVRGSVANRLRGAKKSGTYVNVLKEMFVDMDTNFGAGDDTEPIEGNIFYKQANDNLKDPRRQMMGEQSDDFINLSEYHKWSTDLEAIMDVFVIQGLKYKAFNNVSATMRATNTVLNWYKTDLMGNRLGNLIDWNEAMKTINLDMRDRDSGTAQSRASKIVNRLASMGMYAGNPITAASVLLGNELTLLSESVANSITGTNRFKPGSVTRAKGIVASALSQKAFNSENYDKVSLLMQKFRMMNESLTELLNGYHREGDRYIFRSKYWFSMLNGADFSTRSSIMVAQMIEDGTWDAVSVVDGKLVYDETKDERFNGRGRLTKEQGAALRAVIAKNNNQEAYEKLNWGYDDNMSNSIRSLSNYLIGTNDRESRAIMNFTWWGRIFGASKGWLSAKSDRWFLGIGSTHIPDSAVVGEYQFETSETGEVNAFWKGDQMEGIIVSWLALIDNLRRKRDERAPLNDVQKRNITRSVGDMILLAASYLIAQGLRDDDDETTTDDILAGIVVNGMNDLSVGFIYLTDPEFLWTPITLEWLRKSITNVFTGVTGGDPDKIMKSIPIANQLERYYEVMANNDFELVEK